MFPVIFIPTYNSEKFLEKTLDSLMEQTGVGKFPICVIDNDSTDKTRDIARSYHRVEVFKNDENIGRIQNWNKCLDMFRVQKGFDCMKFVFAGDTLKKNCLKYQVEALNPPMVGMVTCAHTVEDKVGKYVMRHFDTQKVLTPKESLDEAKYKGNWIAGSTACPLFTKELLGDIRFNTGLDWAADWMFWTQLSEKTNIRYLDADLVKFNMAARKGYIALSGTPEARQDEEFVEIYIQDKLLKL